MRGGFASVRPNPNPLAAVCFWLPPRPPAPVLCLWCGRPPFGPPSLVSSAPKAYAVCTPVSLASLARVSIVCARGIGASRCIASLPWLVCHSHVRFRSVALAMVGMVAMWRRPHPDRRGRHPVRGHQVRGVRLHQVVPPCVGAGHRRRVRITIQPYSNRHNNQSRTHVCAVARVAWRGAWA